MYHVETERINEAVRRNPKRFLERYCLSLREEEYTECCLKSQNATSNKRGGISSAEKVFTEQGVARLSSILTSDIAVNVSLRIMDAFVEMRHYLSDNALVFNRLDRIEIKQLEADKKFETIFKELEVPKPKKSVLFFHGQMFDAFSCIADIIKTADKEFILIDSYTDTATLALLSYISEKKWPLTINAISYSLSAFSALRNRPSFNLYMFNNENVF